MKIHQSKSMNNQRGSALAIGLIFLVILTLLGLTASSGAIHQELMTRNVRDSQLALQAAEAALRGAETWLREQTAPEPANYAEIYDIGYCNTGNSDCANQNESWWLSDANTIEFGVLSGVDAVRDVKTQPRYVIELYGRGNSGGISSSQQQEILFYRITARGTGMNDNTVRMVRSIYRW